MARRITRRWISALLVGLVASACGEGGTAPRLQETDDELVAALLASVGIAEDQASTASMLPSSTDAAVAMASASDHGACTFVGDAGRVVCPDVVRRGLTISRSFALYDAAGAVQARRDSNTTTINTRVHVRGTVAMDGGKVTVDRRSDLTAGGVQRGSPARTLDGTEHGTLVTERPTAHGMVTSSATFGDTTRGLVLPKPGAVAKWPLAGTVIHAHSGTQSREGSTVTRAFARRTVMEFDGSSTVKVTMTVNGNTRTCTRNLETRQHTCAR